MLFENYLGECYNITKENLDAIKIREDTNAENSIDFQYAVFVVLKKDVMICFNAGLTLEQAKIYVKQLTKRINSSLFADDYKEMTDRNVKDIMKDIKS